MLCRSAFYNFIFLLKYSWFTVLCQPLLYSKVTDLYTVISDSATPWTEQHARLPCLSVSPGTCSASCPLSQWCHPTISSSFAPFSSCPRSFPASGSFPRSWLFTLGGQSIGTSVSVLPMNTQGWFPLGLPGLMQTFFFFTFFLIMVYRGHWTYFPMLYSKTLLFIHHIYNSLHLLILNSQPFPPPWSFCYAK